jgi:hypothetical protein
VPRTCNQLEGTNLVASTRIKVARLAVGHGRTLVLGCPLPHGLVREIDVERRRTTRGVVYRDVFTALETRARILRYRDDNGFRFDHASEQLRVVNLQTGRSYVYYELPVGGASTTNCGFSYATNTPPPARTILGADGRLAVMFTEGENHYDEPSCYPHGGEVVVAGFGPAGGLNVVDIGKLAEIPVRSLTLNGRAIGWTKNGIASTDQI